MTINNEVIFIIYVFIVGFANLIALRLGRDALIATISLQAILSNLFVLKEIPLFGMCATASDSLAIGSVLGLNLLQEYFDKKSAYKAVKISFFCSILYSIFSTLHLSYWPTMENTYDPHYNAILIQSFRLIIVSGIVYLIVDTLDSFVYGYLKRLFNDKYLIIRSWITTLSTQLLDTILFSFLGLYKINKELSSINIILQIIMTAYIIKIITIFLITPFIAVSKKIICKN